MACKSVQGPVAILYKVVKLTSKFPRVLLHTKIWYMIMNELHNNTSQCTLLNMNESVSKD